MKLLAKWNDLPFVIPRMWEVTDHLKQVPFDGQKKYILRSALTGEGREKLLSGKSESIPHISDYSKYQSAWNKLKKQLDLEDLFLQEEVNHDRHITVIIDGNFLYAEYTGDENGKILMNDQFCSGDPSLCDQLNPVFQFFKPKKWGKVLLELGCTKGTVYLYQAQSCPQVMVNQLMGEYFFAELMRVQELWKRKPHLLELIKREWKAFCFRNKTEHENSLSNRFQNWLFLFHYFYLFCLRFKLPGGPVDFEQFLTEVAYSQDLISRLAYEHVKLAQALNPLFDGQFNSGFNGSSEKVFIGKDTIEISTRSQALFQAKMDPHKIYRAKADQIIFTQDNQLLSHGFLAAVELGNKVVGNIPAYEYESLQRSSTIKIDFDKRVLIQQ